MAEEIEQIAGKYALKQIGFVDSIFPFEKDYTLALCDEIIKRGLNRELTWVSETKIDILDEELVKGMSLAGCRRSIFGLESGSQQTLNRVGKRIDFAKSKEVIAFLMV